MDPSSTIVQQQSQSATSFMPRSPEKGIKLSLSSHTVIFSLSTAISVALFLLIVFLMQIPGILVMIAVVVANVVSQLLAQRKKRLLWAFSALLVSSLLIMTASWLLVHVFHL